MSKLKELLKKLKPNLKPRKKVPKEKKEKPIKEKKIKEKKPKKEKRIREKKEFKPPKFFKNKKALIGVASVMVLLIVVIGVLGSLGGKEPMVADDPVDSEDAAGNQEEIVEEPALEEEQIASFVDMNIITYTFDGNIQLYNTAGGLMDEVDLATLNFDMLYEFNKRNDVPEVAVEEVVEDVQEDMVEEVPQDESQEITEEAIKESSEEADIAIEDAQMTPVFILDQPVETEFKVFKNDGESLFFIDLKRETLVEVGEGNGIIVVKKVITDDIVGSIVDVKSALGGYFIVMPGGFASINPEEGTIAPMLVEGLLLEKEGLIEKYIGKSIGFIEYIENPENFYFTIDSGLFRVDYSFMNKDIETEADFIELLSLDFVDHIDLGDSIIDMFAHNGQIYVVNQFGFDMDNSVLMKIGNNEDGNMMVDDIIELKGVYSKSIGMHDGKVYIRQSEFIKEVDLEIFSPEKAYTRTAGIPVIVDGEYVYTIEDGNLNVSSLMDRANPVRTIEVEGDTLYKGPILH